MAQQGGREFEHRSSGIARGTYDCVRPNSQGKSLALMHLNGMIGWGLKSYSVTEDYRKISIAVSTDYVGPTRSLIEYILSLAEDLELQRVWLDQSMFLREISLLFRHVPDQSSIRLMDETVGMAYQLLRMHHRGTTSLALPRLRGRPPVGQRRALRGRSQAYNVGRRGCRECGRGVVHSLDVESGHYSDPEHIRPPPQGGPRGRPAPSSPPPAYEECVLPVERQLREVADILTSAVPGIRVYPVRVVRRPQGQGANRVDVSVRDPPAPEGDRSEVEDGESEASEEVSTDLGTHPGESSLDTTSQDAPGQAPQQGPEPNGAGSPAHSNDDTSTVAYSEGTPQLEMPPPQDEISMSELEFGSNRDREGEVEDTVPKVPYAEGVGPSSPPEGVPEVDPGTPMDEGGEPVSMVEKAELESPEKGTADCLEELPPPDRGTSSPSTGHPISVSQLNIKEEEENPSADIPSEVPAPASPPIEWAPLSIVIPKIECNPPAALLPLEGATLAPTGEVAGLQPPSPVEAPPNEFFPGGDSGDLKYPMPASPLYRVTSPRRPGSPAAAGAVARVEPLDGVPVAYISPLNTFLGGDTAVVEPRRPMESLEESDSDDEILDPEVTRKELEFRKLTMFRLGVAITGAPMITLPMLHYAEQQTEGRLCLLPPLACDLCNLKGLYQLTMPLSCELIAMCLTTDDTITPWQTELLLTSVTRPLVKRKFRLLRCSVATFHQRLCAWRLYPRDGGYWVYSPITLLSPDQVLHPVMTEWSPLFMTETGEYLQLFTLFTFICIDVHCLFLSFPLLS